MKGVNQNSNKSDCVRVDRSNEELLHIIGPPNCYWQLKIMCPFVCMRIKYIRSDGQIDSNKGFLGSHSEGDKAVLQIGS